MTPLPGALGGKRLVVWRLEATKHLPTWQNAEGAFLVGGRWSSPGSRVLYTSVDPSTAILEVGVHKGFDVLDSVHHSLLEIKISDPAQVHVVNIASIPNPNWLRPGTVSSNQQAFGDLLLNTHAMVFFPSVVSRHSWNLLINMPTAAGAMHLTQSEAFALDPRLTPAAHAKKP